MDVNAVMKQNFVYRMISETFIDFNLTSAFTYCSMCVSKMVNGSLIL